MGRRLTTYVHLDGQAWGPNDDVPDDVAERITNPDVWADDPAETSESDAEEPKQAPKRRTAAKKD